MYTSKTIKGEKIITKDTARKKRNGCHKNVNPENAEICLNCTKLYCNGSAGCFKRQKKRAEEVKKEKSVSK